MSWTRLDDTWTDNTVLADLSFEDRWHYLAMIQFCSRTQKFDGLVRVVDARRCSDHPDPDKAHTNLVNVGLLVNLGKTFKLTQIDEHIPPPSVRENSEKSKVRMKRMRQHKVGDHSICLPDHCEQVGLSASLAPASKVLGPAASQDIPKDVTQSVTRNTRTGQDRTGQLLTSEQTTRNEGGGPNGKQSLETNQFFNQLKKRSA